MLTVRFALAEFHDQLSGVSGYVGTVILKNDSLQLQRPLSLLLQATRLQENTKTIS